MQTKNVILALGRGFYAEAIRNAVAQCQGVNVVAEVMSPLELLCHTELDEADAVIIEADTSELGQAKMPGVLTHLFVEFPQILAIAVDPKQDRVTVYRQQIHEQVLEGPSLVELLRELNQADSSYWMRA